MKILLTAFILGLSTTGTAWAEDDPYQLQVSVQQVEETFATRATFRLPLTLCQAWQFISDYDAATGIPGVVSSKTTRLGPGKFRVERLLQETVLFFPIRMRTVLEFTETPEKVTEFVQIEGQAKMHRGSWHLEQLGSGTFFRYMASSEPDSSLPMPVIHYFLDKRLKSSFLAMVQQGAQRSGKRCDL